MRWMAVLALCAIAGQAHAKTLPPKDECAGIKDFQPTRQSFLSAIKARDTAALLKLVAPDIIWSFGDNGGKAGFINKWGLNDRRASPIWAELDKMTALGCSTEPGFITFPYLTNNMPESTSNQMSWVMAGTYINLRSAPSLTANVIAKLSWEVVTEEKALNISPAESNLWMRVRTESGLTG